ncbi:MAG: hypothetical protein Q8P01_03500 [bacterium]|nr:hypothetical protein [bacterium]
MVADPFQEPEPLLREREPFRLAVSLSNPGLGLLLLEQEPVQEHSGSVQTEEFRQGLQQQGSATPERFVLLLVQVLVVSLSNYLLEA